MQVPFSELIFQSLTYAGHSVDQKSNSVYSATMQITKLQSYDLCPYKAKYSEFNIKIYHSLASKYFYFF